MMDFLSMLLDDISRYENAGMTLSDLENFMQTGQYSNVNFNFSIVYLMIDSPPIIFSGAIPQLRNKYGLEEKLIRKSLCKSLHRIALPRNDYYKLAIRKLIFVMMPNFVPGGLL